MVIVNSKMCTGCGGCINICPVFALSLDEDDNATVNEKCNDCEICVRACPVECISK
jgi:Fe-S-cluster-containing hydrogenase component 2